MRWNRLTWLKALYEKKNTYETKIATLWNQLRAILLVLNRFLLCWCTSICFTRGERFSFELLSWSFPVFQKTSCHSHLKATSNENLKSEKPFRVLSSFSVSNLIKSLWNDVRCSLHPFSAIKELRTARMLSVKSHDALKCRQKCLLFNHVQKVWEAHDVNFAS